MFLTFPSVKKQSGICAKQALDMSTMASHRATIVSHSIC